MVPPMFIGVGSMVLPMFNIKSNNVRGRYLAVPLLALISFTLLSFTNTGGSAHANVIPGMGGLKSGGLKWQGWDVPGEPRLTETEVNVTFIPGQTVQLPCKVINLHDKRVSWIRSRDLTVLAVDHFKVSTDERISVLHQEESEDWQLEIRGVTPEDAGGYDCQINTYPKISTKVNLIMYTEQSLEKSPIHDIPVSDSEYSGLSHSDDGTVQVRILGARKQVLGVDETLQLTCEATGKYIRDLHARTRIPNTALISWTVDGAPIHSLYPDHKLEVEESWGYDQYSVESRVTISYLQLNDGGTFACHLPLEKHDKVIVHVVESDDDLMLHGRSSSGDSMAHDVNISSGRGGDQGGGMIATAGAVATTCVIGILVVLLILQTVLCFIYIKRTT